MTSSPRFIVYDVTTRTAPALLRDTTPYWVVDTTTNATIDRYASKRAAAQHARQLNATPTPARRAPRRRTPCAACSGEGWFTTQTAGTVMCSDCRGTGKKGGTR